MGKPQLRLSEETAASTADAIGTAAVAQTHQPHEDKAEARSQKPPSALGKLGRWHFRKGKSLSSVAAELKKRNANYVVLPAAVGDGPALLLADADIPKVVDLITWLPLGTKVAVYCTTDLPGFSFQQHWRRVTDATNFAILPSNICRAILERGVVDEGGIRRISDKDHLAWLIYRALFLSGDPTFAFDADGTRLLGGPLVNEIRQLATKTQNEALVDLHVTDLCDYLRASDWFPPNDLLRRLSTWNSFAKELSNRLFQCVATDPPGMAVFFVRQELVRVGLDDALSKMLRDCGFEIFKSVDLDERQIEQASRSVRGGNWGPGAHPVSGGPPTKLLITHDLIPLAAPDDWSLRHNYPHLDNIRILRAKGFARGLVSERLPAGQWFNPVHSTDRTSEAWSAIRTFVPELEDELRDLANARRAAFEGSHEVLRDLTQTGARAKIELISYRGDKAVKKTFRPTAMRFLEREAAFHAEMSPLRPEILPVLERGPNYLITPYLEAGSIRRTFGAINLPRLMALCHVRQLAELLLFLLARGYDPIDLTPHNILFRKDGKLAVIDFEYFHRSDRPVSPENCACLHGVTNEFSGEWPCRQEWDPEHWRKRNDPYRVRWFSYTGLPVRSFLYDPPMVQRIKRAIIFPSYLVRKVFERLYRHGRDGARLALARGLNPLLRASRALALARRS